MVRSFNRVSVKRFHVRVENTSLHRKSARNVWSGSKIETKIPFVWTINIQENGPAVAKLKIV